MRSAILAVGLAGSLLVADLVSAQVPDPEADTLQEGYVRIFDISLEGNRKTKPLVLYRELTFAAGDTVAVAGLMGELERSRNQLMNTGLFHEAVLNLHNWQGDSVRVAVVVKERWYTIPLPAVNLYDRNFNVWWVDHNHDIRWLQLGGRFYQKNLTGRNDELRAELLFGFQQRFSLQYSLPFFDASQDFGFSAGVSYIRSKNISYAVEDNKELIYEDVNTFQRRSFAASIDAFYKPGFHHRYALGLSYRNNSISDTVAELNPDYFLDGKTNQQYLQARFTFTRDYRDIIAYPLTGNLFEGSVTKLGFGLFDDVDLWSATALFHQYVKFQRRWFLASQTKVKITFPEEQPYNLERGVGYGSEYVAGYEYYAIDGQMFGFSKLVVKYKIVDFKVKTDEKNPFTKGAGLPIAVYLKSFADGGYVKDAVYDSENALTNSFLFGYGLGLDLVLFYDTSIKFEYSFNLLGEHGLFLHYSTYF